MDHNLLLSELVKLKCATFATIITETIPDLKSKKSILAGHITKRAKVNVLLNFSYENSVNNQRKREDEVPDFEVQPRKWGVRLNKTPLVYHNGKYYLEVKVQKSLDCRYFVDGQEVQKAQEEEIKQELKKKKNPQNQQLEKSIILRDYRLENIREIHLMGKVLT